LKGFGYLEPDDRTSPVFADFHAIDTPGCKTLGPGQTVVFTTTITDRGPEAATVHPYPRPCASRW
jgi:cold shock CspA family protein